MDRKNILITGSHRSGSTWLGSILSVDSNVSNIHEPFHLRNRKEYDNYPFTHIFPYVEESTDLAQDVKRYMDEVCKRHHKGKDDSHSLLFKDPMAFFSLEWLAEHYNCHTIITLRHPLAFVASLKNKNWSFDFRNLLNQHHLVARFLMPFRDEMQNAIQENAHIIDQGILLWKIFAYVAKNLMNVNPGLLAVKNEDLSIQPFVITKNLLQQLNLEYTENIREYIIESSQKDKVTRLTRVSAYNVFNWVEILEHDEYKRVYDKLHAIANIFYSQDSWLVPGIAYKRPINQLFPYAAVKTSLKEINFKIDRINKLKVKNNLDSLLDQLRELSDLKNIRLTGRVFNSKYKYGYKSIIFQIGDKVIKGKCGLLRQDVAERFGSENLLNTGFEITIPKEVLLSKEISSFQAYVTDLSDHAYFAADQNIHHD